MVGNQSISFSSNRKSDNDAEHALHFLSSPARRRASKNTKKRENTFVGVFLPCIQSILNIILFLRLPSITAQAGVIQTTLIIFACVASTIITAISLSAIATNGKIRQGGAYFVVSRTLGLEVGGALGLLYYLGSTLACSMCVLGGVEAFLLAIFGDSPVMTDRTNGALGGSYESVDNIELGDGLARRFLMEGVTMEEIEQAVNIMPVTFDSTKEQETFSDITYSPSNCMDTQTLSIMLVLLLAVFVGTGFRSAHAVSSHIFLILIILSIFSSFFGCLLFATHHYSGTLHEGDFLLMDNIYPRYEPDPISGITPTFVSLLALFYPSVTGILAGLNNSEYLADPSKSIPNGTISAIIFTTLIYISFAWLYGTTIANQTLKSRKFLVSAIAFPSPMLVKLGVLVSVVGAALGYMSSATTLLSTIAMDDSMPILNFIRKGDPSRLPEKELSNPSEKKPERQKVNKRALVLTWALASLPTLSGNLDKVTPFISMCYLVMYSGINCSCFLLSISNSPGFRPTFKYFHWSISLLGFVWCLALALLIDTSMACLALALFLVLLTYNNKMVEKRRDWGDVFDSVKYNVVTQTLQSLNHTTTSDLNAKNWRPQLLSFVDMNSSGLPTNLYLLSLASQLKKGKGLNIVVGLILRDLCQSQPELEGHQGIEDEHIVGILSKGKHALQSYMHRENISGFAEVSGTTRRGMCDAAWSAVLHSGLGCLSPNTVLFSFPKRAERNGPNQFWSEQDFLKTITGIRNLKVALMIFRGNNNFPTSQELITSGIIDVWWIMHDGGLLLLLPFIMSKNAVWGKSGARLRIFAVLTSRTDPDRFEEAVKRHLKGARIIAEVRVVDMSDYSLEEDMRIGKTSTIGEPTDCSSSNHDKTLVEAFCEVQDDVPYVRLSEQINIDMGHAEEQNDNSSCTSRSSLIGNNYDDSNNDDCFKKIHSSQERMRNARSLNEMIRLHSSVSSLVVVNMPNFNSEYSSHFFEYVDTMCEGIENTLLIRGSGKEIITTFA